ncbi:hypothetical protein EOA30_12175 [Mesorhizobium sp. M8A.F.Ca.ET.059.01.1.1]|nr:hypothetical protein EOA30_12175 [Mesorhizobium sp. M8A.F.Ca.ET.059.01.1.1]
MDDDAHVAGRLFHRVDRGPALVEEAGHFNATLPKHHRGKRCLLGSVRHLRHGVRNEFQPPFLILGIQDRLEQLRIEVFQTGIERAGSFLGQASVFGEDCERRVE